MDIAKKYLQYGVSSDWAAIYERKKLNITTFRNSTKKTLQVKYKIDENQIDFVKHCLKRKPINEDIIQALLHNSQYLCCVCHGSKSDAYIIHHIDPYANSQSNSYENLAVLCPNDHDLAHREGQSLTNKLTKKNILYEKRRWEKEVEDRNVQLASQNMDIHEVDFINAPRILSLYVEIFKKAPSSQFSSDLVDMGALNSDGSINSNFIRANNKRDSISPFNYFGPSGSWALGEHYKEIFKQILKKITFEDLDLFLTPKKAADDLVGSFCFYVGGLYGAGYESPITLKSPLTHIYFHKRKYFVEWLVDPKYIVSITAETRLAGRPQYLVYGRILSVGTKEWKGKEYVHFDIRPYLFGVPIATKSRKPVIHFRHKYGDFF